MVAVPASQRLVRGSVVGQPPGRSLPADWLVKETTGDLAVVGAYSSAPGVRNPDL